MRTRSCFIFGERQAGGQTAEGRCCGQEWTRTQYSWIQWVTAPFSEIVPYITERRWVYGVCPWLLIHSRQAVEAAAAATTGICLQRPSKCANTIGGHKYANKSTSRWHRKGCEPLLHTVRDEQERPYRLSRSTKNNKNCIRIFSLKE